MTTVTERPAAVERASREHVAALMLKAVRDHGLSWPRDIHYIEGATSGDLLDIRVDGRAAWLGWVDYFGEPEYRSGLVVHTPWRGWTVLLAYRETPMLDAATAALIDEVTATCACEVVHPLGCPGDLAATPECPGCHVLNGSHQPHCYAVAPVEIVHLVTRSGKNACGDPNYEQVATAYARLVTCPPCAAMTLPTDVITCACGDAFHDDGCPAKPDIAEMFADMDAAELAGICMYCPSVHALTAELTIAEHRNADTGEMPCTGSGEWPATDWGDEEIPKGTRAELEAFLAARWPSRVDVEAAAQIPVTVVDITPRCSASYYGDTCPGEPIYGDGYCGTHTGLVTREHVAEQFGERWTALNVLQQARLVEACDTAGWSGDWAAAYRNVVTDTALHTSEQIATAVDELMADEGDVDHDQLADALTVDPDEEIAYEIAHRHDAPQIVEHDPADSAKADDGRGGAGVARMGVPIDLTRGTS